MRPSSDLHRLIHSLSPAEKRYFRVQNAASASNSIELFDLLVKQKSFDEEALKAKLSHSPILKHLPSEKNYLRALLLRTMRNFHDTRNASSRLSGYLREIEFLSERQLWGSAEKLIKKAKKTAHTYQKFPLLLELLDHEARMAKATLRKGLPERTEAIIQERRQVLSLIQNETESSNQYDRLYARIREEYHPENGSQDLPNLEKPSADQSFSSQLKLITAQALQAQIHGQLDSAKISFKKVVELWESNPDFIKDDPATYIRALSNYLTGCHHGRDYQEFRFTLDKIHQFSPANSQVGYFQFILGDYHELLYRLASGDFGEAQEMEKSIQGKLKRYEALVSSSRKMAFMYNLCALQLFSGRCKQALASLRAISTELTDQRQDLQQAAQLIYLLVHFELKNWDLLHSETRNAERRLARKSPEFALEKIVLKYLRQTASANIQARPVILREFHQALQTYLDAEEKPLRSGLTEVFNWLEAKIKGISVPELIQHKFRTLQV